MEVERHVVRSHFGRDFPGSELLPGAGVNVFLEQLRRFLLEGACDLTTADRWLRGPFIELRKLYCAWMAKHDAHADSLEDQVAQFAIVDIDDLTCGVACLRFCAKSKIPHMMHLATLYLQ
eukprot:TRINITY_DN15678_c0_g1_i1.p1 TRINITY_DN15678_c0_g1~~TRINITY_DN15678_c0_g1_i1.p1  ORF type:complete len:120 (-),score=14.97 TRINITY_DN15678_c0_g1_i1:112-471(-)